MPRAARRTVTRASGTYSLEVSTDGASHDPPQQWSCDNRFNDPSGEARSRHATVAGAPSMRENNRSSDLSESRASGFSRIFWAIPRLVTARQSLR